MMSVSVRRGRFVIHYLAFVIPIIRQLHDAVAKARVGVAPDVEHLHETVGGMTHRFVAPDRRELALIPLRVVE